jgi:hypothetical protein
MAKGSTCRAATSRAGVERHVRKVGIHSQCRGPHPNAR